MKRLAIIGSGDLAQQIAYLVRTDEKFDVVGYFDDFKESGILINGIPVLGTVADITLKYQLNLFDQLIIGIGYKHMEFKKDLYLRLSPYIPFAKFIHSSCVCDNSVTIGDGSILYPGCIIDQNVTIQENVLVNLGCCISHDGVIGAHSFLSPRVAMAGFVNIGKACIIGINTTIIDNITLADDVQTGGGAVVIKNIVNKGLYVGNPVKFINNQ